MWSSRLFPPLLLLSLAFGQSSQDRIRLGPVFVKTPEHIEMLVEFPQGVAATANDVQLVEDGESTIRANALTKFRDSGWSLAVVLAMDMSRSLPNRDLEEAKSALKNFATQLKDPLALVTFADEPAVIASFEAAREEMIANLLTLRLGGKQTRLYGAVDTSLELFQTRPDPERRLIIVLSDGAEASPERPEYIDQILNKAEQRRVAIDTIWIGKGPAWTRNTLVRMAERTQGLHNDAKYAGEIQTALGKVMEQINGAFIASFDRKLEAGLTTQRIGITINQPGVEQATIALSTPIPRSSTRPAVEPPPRGILSFLWGIISDLQSWLAAGLAALTLYILYLVIYLFVRKYYPERLVLFPFCPFPLRKWEEPTLPPPATVAPIHTPHVKSKRRTIVEHAAPTGSFAESGSLVLQAVKGPLEGQRIPVGKDVFRIGADPDNDLPISSDIYLSGQHAAIQASGGKWILVDRGSRNGTFVDGQKVTSGPGHHLHPGQSIQVGTSEFRVIIESSVSTHDTQPPR
jgi:FHA domain/von Willebrand factor type A domain